MNALVTTRDVNEFCATVHQAYFLLFYVTSDKTVLIFSLELLNEI